MYALREGGGRVLTIEGRGDLHEMPDAPDWPPRVRPERPGEDEYLQAWESSLSESLQEGRRCVSHLVFCNHDVIAYVGVFTAQINYGH
jgi:hypothetical protein